MKNIYKKITFACKETEKKNNETVIIIIEFMIRLFDNMNHSNFFQKLIRNFSFGNEKISDAKYC